MLTYNRRKFIGMLGAIYGSILLYPSCSRTTAVRYRVFTDAEADCLIALCEQIIPADQDPGATDAGVINYIDKQAAERFHSDVPTFKQGIAALQEYCKTQHGKLFEQLDSDTQIEIMKDMEKNKLPETSWGEVKQSSFMRLAVDRTMQGFYGAPRHGGNKDYASFKMMKLDYPLLVGQNRYNKLRTKS
jgi:gluconate 2-dehydrogenase gamma chain